MEPHECCECVARQRPVIDIATAWRDQERTGDALSVGARLLFIAVDAYRTEETE